MSKYILSIEDNTNDIELMKRIFTRDIKNVNLKHITTGKEAIAAFESDHFFEQYPALILLDIKLSGISGLDILEIIKKNECFDHIPVVVFSSSVQQSDMKRAFKLRANSYIEKPKDFQQLKEAVRILVTYWLELNKY